MARRRNQSFTIDFAEGGNVWLPYFGIGVVLLVIYIALTSKRVDTNLTGVWKIESQQTNGQSPARARNLWVFDGGSLKIVSDDRITYGTYSTNVDATPHHLDMSNPLFPHGIYEIDGNSLHIALSAINVPRPTDFQTELGDLTTVSQLRRLAIDPRSPDGRLKEILLAEFGSAKVYPQRIEFDRAAKDFVGELWDKVAVYDPTYSDRDAAVCHVSWLVAEVNNGGFEQFFYNPAGTYALETIDCLKSIGATETAAMLRSACDLFPNGIPPKEQSERQRALEQFTLEQFEILADLDETFYSRREDVHVLLRAYWENSELR